MSDDRRRKMKCSLRRCGRFAQNVKKGRVAADEGVTSVKTAINRRNKLKHVGEVTIASSASAILRRSSSGGPFRSPLQQSSIETSHSPTMALPTMTAQQFEATAVRIEIIERDLLSFPSRTMRSRRRFTGLRTSTARRTCTRSRSSGGRASTWAAGRRSILFSLHKASRSSRRGCIGSHGHHRRGPATMVTKVPRAPRPCGSRPNPPTPPPMALPMPASLPAV